MTIYKFPSEFGRGREPKKDKKQSIHHPEFIDIEDLQHEESLFGEEQAEIYTSVDELEKVNLPFLLRIFTFGVSCALFIGSALLLLLAAATGLVALLTFFQVASVKKRLQRYWSYSKRMFVTALGLSIMCVSPALGMGFIALYFALQGESVENNILGRFFKQSR